MCSGLRTERRLQELNLYIYIYIYIYIYVYVTTKCSKQFFLYTCIRVSRVFQQMLFHKPLLKKGILLCYISYTLHMRYTLIMHYDH